MADTKKKPVKGKQQDDGKRNQMTTTLPKKTKKPVKKAKTTAKKEQPKEAPFHPKLKANNKDVSGRVKAAPQTRMAQSASINEMERNRDANAMMLAAANMQVPMQGGTAEQAQANVANTGYGNIGAGQAQHFAAGNDAIAQPPMPASGDLRQKLLQTMALQPMYANPAQTGGTTPWAGNTKADETERDFQVNAHNQAQAQGLHEYEAEDMKEALKDLLSGNDMGEGDPIDEVTQAAINRARAEQSVMAGRQLTAMQQGQPAPYPEPVRAAAPQQAQAQPATATPQPPKPKLIIPTRK